VSSSSSSQASSSAERPARAGELMAQDQRLGLGEREHHGVDRVAAQLGQRGHALIAVDQHEAPRRLAGHDPHRALLAVLRERGQQAALAGGIADAKPRVLAIELVELDLHPAAPA